ncbi:glycoside hydrolase family 30 protein [Geofilum sp. OHC36d9]|uniref:glycoside hydrolase family 30 protein n=1 Tax=Geofilum sp. OHC36d9 TaxID=3458413 RepID=UPI0040336535
MTKKSFCITLAAALVFYGSIQAQTVTTYKPASVSYVNLADDATVTGQPVITKKMKIKPSEKSESSVKIKLDAIIHPNLSGIGGAFNEQGGEAFMSLSKNGQKTLARNLFSAQKGIGFSMCRTAVGSSDFGLGAYSYSETPEDYEMNHFSVARDEKTVIPFINAAYSQNSELKIFASPWSPPGWMKYSGIMDGGKKNAENNKLKADPKIYAAYALYFTKYVQEYAKRGVHIDRLVIQNETDMNPKYPGCDMSPEQMAELAFDHIRPAFKKAGVKTEIWAGTFRAFRKDAEKFLTLKGSEVIDGIGLQYCRRGQIKSLNSDYPDMDFMHTEGRCENGKNSMEQARKRFGEVCMWLNGGCENFCYWNMVLNEESKSGWGWKQNSLIKIDRQAKTVTYNPDYAPMALLSKFIRPGDQSITTETPEEVNALAVRNDHQLVVFLQNDADAVATQNITLADKNYTVELPAKSLCAFVFKAVK